MNIILCGPPLCGKSHLGKLLASQLGWELLDSDRLIEMNYLESMGESKTCREISLIHGEHAFRDLERKAIDSLKPVKNKVIATGGGTLLCSDNQHILTHLGKIFYLKTPINRLLERLKQKKELPSYLNPQNPEKAYEELINQRLAIYQKYAHHIIDTHSLGEGEIIDLIIGEYHGK